MPRRPVKPFIDKKNAESFIVVHRSLQDPLQGDETASPMVLLSASARLAEPEFHGSRPHGARVARGAPGEDDGEGGGDGSGSVATRATRASRRSVARTVADGAAAAGGSDAVSVARSSRSAMTSRSVRGAPEVRRLGGGLLELREVDEAGLPLDGYDYARHLAVGGGGLFISADGTMHRSGSSVAGGSVAAQSLGGASRISRSTRGGPGAAAASMGRSAGVPADEEREDTRNDEMLDGLYDTHAAASALRLPRDVLPSLPEDLWDTVSAREGEGGRMGSALDALTLVEEAMPLDMREVMEAIAEADTESEGEEEEEEEEEATRPGIGTRAPVIVRGAAVEALDDDFVAQALGRKPIPKVEGAEEEEEEEGGGGAAAKGEVVGAGFDFDAHVARLMARAEGLVVDTEELDDISEGEEEEEWDEDDEDGDEGLEDDDDEEGEGEETLGDNALQLTAKGRGGASGGVRPSDSTLEAMLSSTYADEEIGELDEYDPRVKHDGFAWEARMAAQLQQAEKGIEADNEQVSEAGALAATAAAQRSARNIIQHGAASGPALLHLASEHLARRAASEGSLYSGAAKEAVAAIRAANEADRLRRKAEWSEGAVERAAKAAAAAAEAEAAAKVSIAEALQAAAAAAAASGPQVVVAPASTPAPAAPPATAPSKPSASFAINLSAFGGGARPALARIAQRVAVKEEGEEAQTTAAAPSSTASTPADPTSSAPPSSTGAAVPFGCAEEDLPLDALDFMPAVWSQPKVRAEYDVETVVSTFSTSLHHPASLGDARASVVSASRGNGPRRLGGAASRMGSGGDDDDVASRGGGRSVVAPSEEWDGPQPIRCSRKTGLPVGLTLVLPGSDLPGAAASHARSGVSADARLSGVGILRRPAATIEEEGEEEEEEEEDGSDYSGDGGEQGVGSRLPPLLPSAARPRGETPEERRARKGAVRAERSMRREAKKVLKLAYKTATLTLTHAAVRRDPLQGGIAL